MKKDRMIDLFEELVPASGKADTVAGELVRATSRLRYRFYNDGDKVLNDYGNETCNGSLRYIVGVLEDLNEEKLSEEFNQLWHGITMSDDLYERQLEVCVMKMADFIDNNNHLKSTPNDDDSVMDFTVSEDFEYYEEDDYADDVYGLYDNDDYDDDYYYDGDSDDYYCY